MTNSGSTRRCVPVELVWVLFSALALAHWWFVWPLLGPACQANAEDCPPAYLVGSTLVSLPVFWLAMVLADRSIRAGRLFAPGMARGLGIATVIGAVGAPSAAGVVMVLGSVYGVALFWLGLYWFARRAGLAGLIGRDLQRQPLKVTLMRMLRGPDAAPRPRAPGGRSADRNG